MFADSYEQSVQHFKDAVEAARPIVTSLGREIQIMEVEDESAPGTHTCLVLIRTRPRAPHLVVISSGVHGIEGYAGSAIQGHLLRTHRLVKALFSCERSDFCFIHAVNPWGMKHLQRTDSENRDLNRNCHIDPSCFRQVLPEYDDFKSLLAPREPAGPQDFANRIRWQLQLTKLLLKHGPWRATQVAVGGQHADQRGLFFGGTDHARHLLKVRTALVECADHAQLERATVIDLHTGLGLRSGVTLMFSNRDEGQRQRLLNTFPEMNVHFDRQVKPHPTGLFCDWIQQALNSHPEVRSARDPVALVYEVGTLGRGGLLSSIESLRRMVHANQMRFYGATSESVRQKIESAFRELFYPSEARWREMLLRNAGQHIPSLCMKAERISLVPASENHPKQGAPEAR